VGCSCVDRLADDLRRDFPEMSGLSARNLKYMRAFAEAHTDPEIVQQVVAQLPWGHNVRLLESVKDPAARLWYARQAIEHGWSRNVLVHQIDSALFTRQGKALTNFARTLPAPQSEQLRYGETICALAIHELPDFGYYNRPLANRGGDPLDGACSDITDCENAW
jgi:predicted nuclease of restriction endonuclease-like (RecB) superfamily